MVRHFLSTLILIVLSGFAHAQPLANRVPSSAMLYFGWAGSASMPAAYADSHLKPVAEASNIGPVFSDFLPALARQLSKNDPDVTGAVEMIKTFGAPLWHHPSAIYFAGVDLKGANGPRPRAAILCQAGADTDAVLAQLQQLVNAAQGLPIPLKAFKSGDLVVFSIGYDQEADAVATAASNITTNPTFQKAIAQVQQDPVVIFYVDASAAISNIDEATATIGGPQSAAEWGKVRDSLGLAGLHQVICTGGLEGTDWSTRMYISAPAPRKGIASLLESKPVADATFKLIPVSAMAAGVERLDIAALLNLARDVAATEANGQRRFDADLDRASQNLGFDIRKDLIEALGDEWAYYCTPGQGAQPITFTFIDPLRKPAEAERSLLQLEKMAQQALARGGPGVQIGQEQAGGQTLHTIATPQFTLAWAIKDGALWLCTSVDALKQDLAAAGNGKSILDNATFTALRKELAASPAISFSYADLPETAKLIYPSVTQLIQMGAMFARQAGVQPPANILPPFDVLSRNLSPAASFTWIDDAGWHSRGRSPFPGSTVFAPNGSLVTIGTTSLAVGIMLPALNAARERANRVKCASNLRQIGQGCLLYANDHKKYPPDLGQLVKDDLNPLVFICPTTGNELPGEIAKALPDVQAKWVNEHADYVYIGADIKPDGNPELILAYEKPDNHDRQGVNILFNDGHVDWCRMDLAKQLITKQQPDAKFP